MDDLILSFAAWAWSEDPSPLVTPEACLESAPFLAAPCLSRLVARAVGIAIITTSFINKAPVVRNILKAKSAAGISVAGTYLEVILYSNAAFYNILRGNPFTAYGETFTVLLQTMVVVGAIWYYEPKIGMSNMAIALATYLVYLFVVFQVLTPDTQPILMMVNPLVLISSRGAQIIENYNGKQTGAQSIATTFMNLAGSAVRMATTIKEVGWDFHILRSYGTSVTLNSVLFAQIILYKANTEKFLKDLEEKKKE